MSSVLTNNGAIVALQTLKGINSNLLKAQNEIATGKSVASAKDSAAIWTIAKTMETESNTYKTIQSGLNVTGAIVGTASDASERITDLITQMRDLAVQGTREGADMASLKANIDGKEAEIREIIKAAEMNGMNLLKTDVDGAGAAAVTVASSIAADGTVGKITVNSADLESDWGSDPTAAAGVAATFGTTADAQSVVTELTTRLQAASTAAAALGSASQRISGQSDFVGKLADSLKIGVGALVDANMEEASARLQALQTQQQLGIQSLSIANQAPQAILALFRG